MRTQLSSLNQIAVFIYCAPMHIKEHIFQINLLRRFSNITNIYTIFDNRYGTYDNSLDTNVILTSDILLHYSNFPRSVLKWMWFPKPLGLMYANEYIREQYEKCFFLDVDMFFTRECNALFENDKILLYRYPGPPQTFDTVLCHYLGVKGPHVGWSPAHYYINGGFFGFTQQQIFYDKINSLLRSLEFDHLLTMIHRYVEETKGGKDQMWSYFSSITQYDEIMLSLLAGIYKEYYEYLNEDGTHPELGKVNLRVLQPQIDSMPNGEYLDYMCIHTHDKKAQNHLINSIDTSPEEKIEWRKLCRI